MRCPCCGSERVSPKTKFDGLSGQPGLDFAHPGNGWTARPGKLLLRGGRTCFECGYVMLFVDPVPASESDNFTTFKL
jgi:hypothetical protein